MSVNGNGADRLLTAKEVSAWLGCSLRTVYNWTTLGVIPHVKLGGSVRFRRESVMAWVLDNEVGAGRSAS